ncbi:MAG TPA: thiamine phosphate synthase, partial [Pyrinomonadaceae bacterium]|nr:thiamine phosphate synthase [Pyrinomonadaceae bacterium]
GQDDLPPVSARKILGENAIIGYSTHNLEQLKKAIKLPIDYVAIGPVFATKTKENPDETIGIEIVEQARKIIGDFPLVAIGGMNSTNFLEVLSSGANSAAIISDLLSEPKKIAEKYTLLKTTINKVKI